MPGVLGLRPPRPGWCPRRRASRPLSATLAGLTGPQADASFAFSALWRERPLFVAVRPIVLYPDPALLEQAQPVERVDDDVRTLVMDLVDTMYRAPGIGLAANQIGVSRRVFVVDLSVGEEPGGLQVFINPIVSELHGCERGEEGCLSFPGVTLDIDRAEHATVEWLDLEGRRNTQTFEGLLARVILHECEHLDGRVFLHNLSPLKRELVKKQIRKRIKAGDWVEMAAQ